jgi:hypothetical protein
VRFCRRFCWWRIGLYWFGVEVVRVLFATEQKAIQVAARFGFILEIE